MDQLARDPKTDGKGTGRENDENCTLVRNDAIQREAAADDRDFSGGPEYEPGQPDTGSQRPRDGPSSSSHFTREKYTRRPSSSSSYTTDSISSSQTESGEVDCAGVVLNCLFCRFHELLLMIPGSCERAAFRCCPAYQLFSSSVAEPAPSHDSPTGLEFDCGLLEACQDTGDCLELAMEISEICYR